jgi:hypothetical protein
VQVVVLDVLADRELAAGEHSFAAVGETHAIGMGGIQRHGDDHADGAQRTPRRAIVGGQGGARHGMHAYGQPQTALGKVIGAALRHRLAPWWLGIWWWPLP